jgi:SAM-dependent methyltransferase
MPATAAEWDEKYRAEGDAAASEAAGFVQELLPLLPLGPALDVACGLGRHALLVAARGQAVTAVDQSGAALEILGRRGRALGYSVASMDHWSASRRPGIRLWQADLEQIALPAEAFALILYVNYLQRSLFAQMERALIAGGMLLFETFTRAQLEFAGGPRNPEYLLEQGELRYAFPGLRTLFYRELRAGKGIAGLIARKE